MPQQVPSRPGVCRGEAQLAGSAASSPASTPARGSAAQRVPLGEQPFLQRQANQDAQPCGLFPLPHRLLPDRLSREALRFLGGKACSCSVSKFRFTFVTASWQRPRTAHYLLSGHSINRLPHSLLLCGQCEGGACDDWGCPKFSFLLYY